MRMQSGAGGAGGCGAATGMRFTKLIRAEVETRVQMNESKPRGRAEEGGDRPRPALPAQGRARPPAPRLALTTPGRKQGPAQAFGLPGKMVSRERGGGGQHGRGAPASENPACPGAGPAGLTCAAPGAACCCRGRHSLLLLTPGCPVGEGGPRSSRARSSGVLGCAWLEACPSHQAVHGMPAGPLLQATAVGPLLSAHARCPACARQQAPLDPSPLCAQWARWSQSRVPSPRPAACRRAV